MKGLLVRQKNYNRNFASDIISTFCCELTLGPEASWSRPNMVYLNLAWQV